MKRMSDGFFRALLPCLLGFCLLAGPAAAATIEASENPLCPMQLSGLIEPGDLEQLQRVTINLLANPERLLNRDDVDPETTQGLVICLDSDGGSFLESTRLAEYVFETGIGTVLGPEARCTGPCAWVFMMGYARGPEELGFTHRRMHHSATLAFRAPHLPFDDTTPLTADTAQSALTRLQTATATLLRIGNVRLPGGRPALDADLLQQAFAHAGDTAFAIDTVDTAGRWRIELFGLTWPERIDTVAAVWACTNLTRWPEDRNETSVDVLGIGSIDLVTLPLPTELDSRAHRVAGLDDGHFNNTCLVETTLGRDPALGPVLFACGTNQGRGVGLGFEECDFATPTDAALFAPYPALAIFAATLRLRDLPEAATEIATRARAEGQAASDPPLHRGCTAPAAALRIARVNEYATLRQSPGFDAETLVQVPLGTRVEITGDAVFTGARSTACRAACTAAGPDRSAPAPDVAACYLDNTIWLPARVDGTEGFIGGRFLAD